MIELEKHHKRSLSIGEKMALLLVGGGIGAIVALLLTPKPGEELREAIADTTLKGLERGREAAHQIGERAGEYYGVTRERAAEIYQTAEEKARQIAEQAREATVAPRNTLAAAIEAGKQAYHQEKRRTEAGLIVQGRPAYPSELGDASDGNKR